MEYKSSKRYIYSCKYHIIFCPKYRAKVLKDGVDDRSKEIIIGLQDGWFKIIEMEVMPDHVHLMVDASIYKSPIDIVKHIKQQTAVILRREFLSLKTKIPNLWTRSAFISSVGTISMDTAKDYIKNQKNRQHQ